MKIDKKSQWLCLYTLGAALTVGTISTTPVFAQDGEMPQTAEELYLEGSQLASAGRLLEAKEILLRVDLAQLERAQRTDVLARLSAIDSQLVQMPEVELRLRKASLSMQRGDLRQASEHARKIMALDNVSEAQVAQTDQLLMDIATAQDDVRTQIPTILESAFQSFDSGNYGQAKAGLQFVFDSGIDLDLDQQARLARYLQKILELEAIQGEFAPAEVSMTVMSDGQDPESDPAEENTEASDDDDAPADATLEEQPATQDEDEQPVVEEQPVEEPDDGVSVADLIQQAQSAQVEADLAEAGTLAASGNYTAALAKYDAVLAVQPTNQSALDGRERMMTSLNVGVEDALNASVNDPNVQAEAVRAEFDNLMAQASQKSQEGDFTRGLDMVARAKVLLDRNRRYLTQTEFEAKRDQATTQFETIQGASTQAKLAEAQLEEKEIRDQRRRERDRLESERIRKINSKLVAIRRLQAAQKYEEAIMELKALLFLDPGNATAQTLHDTMKDVLLYRQYKVAKKDRDGRLLETSVELLEAMKAPHELVEYPSDWPEISMRRMDGLASLDNDADRQVLHALASHNVPINFAGVPFGDAVDFVAQVAKINVDVDWASLEQNFIDRNTPINLKLNDQVNLETVLDRMLKKLGDSEESRPHYGINDGILTISTKEKLQQNRSTHLYDIRDLLIDVPDFDDAPDLGLDALLTEQNDRGFGSQAFGEDDGVQYERGIETRREKIEQIKSVLTTNIDKLSWEVNGGDVSVLQEINGNLVITTTPKNHRAISNLLEKLREIRAIQINVESRFLLVSEDFFEQIGFDLDLYWGGDPYRRDKLQDPNLLPSDLFNNILTGNQSPTSQRQYISLYDIVGQVDGNGNPVFDANGRQITQEVLPNSGIFQSGRNQWSPQAIIQDSLGLANSLFGADGQSFAGQALAASPALSYGMTYLDNIQVDLLITATQADRRSVQLTAPKLTFFNGQRSFVQVTTSQFFVSDLQPIVGTSSAGFDPTLSPLREGVVLDVEGTVSADRRYVTMTVLTSLAKILDIKTTAIPILVGGNVVDSDDGDILSQTAFIERPEIQISRINTTVTVPDRGTVLLGGQSIRNDIEIETGVPVLSKIPIVNRFFTNRIMSTEERTLFILMRPTVIIQQENEDRFFPGLQDQMGGAAGLGGQF